MRRARSLWLAAAVVAACAPAGSASGVSGVDESPRPERASRGAASHASMAEGAPTGAPAAGAHAAVEGTGSHGSVAEGAPTAVQGATDERRVEDESGARAGNEGPTGATTSPRLPPDTSRANGAASDASATGSAAGEPEPVDPSRCRPEGVCPRACPDAEALAAAGLACVPGGYFVRGADDAPVGCVQSDQPRGVTPSVPAARVWIETFAIMTHEVTNAEYRACVEAGACRRVEALYRSFREARQPHTGGTWFDARDYCAWRGLRLPTEAEFEAAIRGPAGERTPFGDAPVTCDEAVIEDERGRSCGVRQPGRDADRGLIAEVGSRPAGRYGLYDMVGNAEEWVNDGWTSSWEACGGACEGVNPLGWGTGPEGADAPRFRSVRGGSWYWPAACADGLHRRRQRPENDPPHHFGFRCGARVEADGGWSGAWPDRGDTDRGETSGE